MKTDKHLINETEYAEYKKSILEFKNDYIAAAMGAFEAIEDSFAELSDKYEDLDIYTLIYKNWNSVAKKSGYSNLSDIVRHMTDYFLTKYWLFGDVFAGMIRNGEIHSDGHCIGHSIDRSDW